MIGGDFEETIISLKAATRLVGSQPDRCGQYDLQFRGDAAPHGARDATGAYGNSGCCPACHPDASGHSNPARLNRIAAHQTAGTHAHSTDHTHGHSQPNWRKTSYGERHVGNDRIRFHGLRGQLGRQRGLVQGHPAKCGSKYVDELKRKVLPIACTIVYNTRY